MMKMSKLLLHRIRYWNCWRWYGRSSRTPDVLHTFTAVGRQAQWQAPSKPTCRGSTRNAPSRVREHSRSDISFRNRFIHPPRKHITRSKFRTQRCHIYGCELEELHAVPTLAASIIAIGLNAERVGAASGIEVKLRECGFVAQDPSGDSGARTLTSEHIYERHKRMACTRDVSWASSSKSLQYNIEYQPDCFVCGILIIYFIEYKILGGLHLPLPWPCSDFTLAGRTPDVG